MNYYGKNILLARASPRRNIQEVEEQNLPCDVLWANFYQEYFAYQEIQKEFLKGKWGYLVLATDDIVVKPENIIQLECDLETKDYPVLAGIMNVNEADYPNGNYAISHELDIWGEVKWIKNLPKDNIFQVKFNGFCLMAIRRDIVERYEFVAQNYMRDKRAGKGDGGSFDLVFCYWCENNCIPIFVDKRINMKHLRQSGRTRLGEEKPTLVLNSYNIPKMVNG